MRTSVSKDSRDGKRPDADAPPTGIRDLLDHLAEEIAADHHRLLTAETERPSEEESPREIEADR